MANLIISEFSRDPSTKCIASQTVAIDAAAASSDALNVATTTIRLFAEAACNVTVGLSADAGAGPIIPLAANEDFILEVHRNSGFTVSVITRV